MECSHLDDSGLWLLSQFLASSEFEQSNDVFAVEYLAFGSTRVLPGRDSGFTFYVFEVWHSFQKISKKISEARAKAVVIPAR